MNNFNEIENELKKLRPLGPSPELVARIETDLRDVVPPGKIFAPPRFKISWLSLGAGLAAAALLLLFARLHFQQTPQTKVASHPPLQSHSERTPATAAERSTRAPEFVPARATEVVYRTEDEGLLFPSDSSQPVRRVRARTRETLQWQNPQTGASLRVSYPAEEVTLLPVYGH
jgi:hypothetical protein